MAAAGAAEPEHAAALGRLPTLQPTTPLDIFLAALAIATLMPIALFLIFQRMFLRGGGLSGALKG